MSQDLASPGSSSSSDPVAADGGMQTRASFYFFVAALILVLSFALWMIRPYLISLAMGGILALLVMPLMRRFRLKMRPTAAAFVATMFVILVVVGPLMMFGGLALRQATTLVGWVMKSDSFDVNALMARLGALLPIGFWRDHAADFEAHLGDVLKEVAQAMATATLEIAKSVPAGLLQVALACLACFFFLLDGAKFFRWMQGKLPLDYDVRTRLEGAFKDTAISVVWASMAAAGTQALVMLVGFLVLRVPAAFVAAGATFVFSWIPLVGSTPVFLGAAGYLVVQGSYTRAAIMVIFGLIAGTVDNFVRPMVLKGRGEMHPLVSLVAIFGGLNLFGFFGVFFGPIIAALLITLLQVWPIVGRRSGLSMGSKEVIPVRTEVAAEGPL